MNEDATKRRQENSTAPGTKAEAENPELFRTLAAQSINNIGRLYRA